jgi:hypothetical protein
MTAYAFSPIREQQDWRIFKYPLVIADKQVVVMPEMAEILSAQFQGDQLVLWVAVDPSRPLFRQSIEIHGTGNPADLRGLRFIGTAQEPSRPLVWHVFAGDVSTLPTREA